MAAIRRTLSLAVALLVLVNLTPVVHSLVDLPTDRKFVFNFFQYFSRVRSELSDQCLTVSSYFRNHTTEDWAVKVVDSNSLIEPGLTSGNFQYLGSFDECLHLKVPDVVKAESHSVQYCTVTFPISLVLSPNEMKNFPPAILAMIPPLAGICVPAACNRDRDIPTILNKFTEITNNSVTLTNCIAPEDLLMANRLKFYHIIIIAIFALILLLCAAGLLVDTEFSKRRSSTWFFRLLYCFSLKRNFAFLFATESKAASKAVPKKKFSNKLMNKAQSEVKINDSKVLSSKLSLISTASTSAANILSPQNLEFAQEDAQMQLPRDQNNNEVSNNKPRLVRPQVESLHGIRFISFVFILVYHTFTEAQVPSVNLLHILDAERTFAKQLITNAGLWVDTFFLLSGFLVAHSMLYQKKGDGESIWSHLWQHPKRMLHRYLRLTPSVAGVLMLSILIEPMGSGPVWYQYVTNSERTCHQNWWVLFTYLNNIFKLNQPNQLPCECLSYLWYLAVDMQFYLVSPILVMFLTHQKARMQAVGVVVNLVAIGASWTITAVLMASFGLTPTVLVTVYDLPYINMVYKTSYCRIGPYCVGILLAYILYRRAVQKSLAAQEEPIAKKPTRNPFFGFFLLLLALSLILTVTLLTYPWLQGADYQNASAVVYGTVHRTVWALGWSILIYACVVGHLRTLNQLLGIGLFQFLSKLTYQSYLLHSVLISAVTNSVRQKIYYSDFNFILDIYKYLILTIMVSMGTFVTFERPLINLEQTFVKW